MALIDKQLVLSDAQAPTTGTTVSTNTIDLGAAGTVPFLGGSPLNDPGRGVGVGVVVQVVTTVTSAGSSTVQVQLVESDNADLSSGTVLCESAAIAKATLVAGYRFRLPALPKGISKRYLGVQYVVATADLTAGAFDAYLVPMGGQQDILV